MGNLEKQEAIPEESDINGGSLEHQVGLSSGIYRVEAQAAKIRENIVDGAVEQGVSIEDAEILSTNVDIHVGSMPDMLSSLSQNEVGIESYIRRARSAIERLSPTTVGSVIPNREGGYSVLIDAEVIADFVDSKKSILGYKLSEVMPDEYKPLALINIVNSVWFHERQHLIQKIHPELKRITEEDKKISKALMLIGASGTAISLVTNTMALSAPNEDIKRNMLLISMASVIIGLGSSGASILHQGFLSRSERNAFAQELPENLEGPFSIVEVL